MKEGDGIQCVRPGAVLKVLELVFGGRQGLRGEGDTCSPRHLPFHSLLTPLPGKWLCLAVLAPHTLDTYRTSSDARLTRLRQRSARWSAEDDGGGWAQRGGGYIEMTLDCSVREVVPDLERHKTPSDRDIGTPRLVARRLQLRCAVVS
ncbi:hypothetical protein E2C01_079698 [Portunus trituberculatus]|uniref:Uncharacterized protein n=1 Tax=Portunus trituberculatus TaxID=210409 RepID=A0A5B7IR96_PORTR|nr:hypothetical protein [Portunus trituberculatus]